MAMTIAQITRRKSLRDLISNLAVEDKIIYHLGMKPNGRATLARVNEQQPNDLYREIFFKLLKRCETNAPQHRFKFLSGY